MVTEIHLVERLERQCTAEAAIQERTWRKHPAELLECFVDAAFEQLASYLSELAFHSHLEVNVDVSCLEAWVG